MYSKYEDIRAAVTGIGYKEASIEKALREFGYQQFPEAGLNDTGISRLIKKINEIEEREAGLMPINRGDSEGVTSLEEKSNKYKLKSENKPVVRRVKKQETKNPTLIRKISQGIYGFSRGFIEHNFMFPTAMRKDWSGDWTKRGKKEGIRETAYFLSFWQPPVPQLIPWVDYLTYSLLYRHNSEIGNIVLGAQIATNMISLGYEITRGIIRKNKKLRTA
jgi:hypothetical protein